MKRTDLLIVAGIAVALAFVVLAFAVSFVQVEQEKTKQFIACVDADGSYVQGDKGNGFFECQQ